MKLKKSWPPNCWKRLCLMMFLKPSFRNRYLKNIIMSENYCINKLYPFQDMVLKLINHIRKTISFREWIKGYGKFFEHSLIFSNRNHYFIKTGEADHWSGYRARDLNPGASGRSCNQECQSHCGGLTFLIFTAPWKNQFVRTDISQYPLNLK